MIRRIPAPLNALVLPALLVLGGVVTTALLAAASPDLVAVHWGPSGEADGFAAPWTVVAVTAAVGIGMSTLLATILLIARAEPGQNSWSHKVIAVMVTAAIGLIVGLGIWILVSQADGGPAPAVGGGLGIGFGAAVISGALAALVLPRAESRRAVDPAPAAPVALGADERVVWTRTARMSAPAIAVISAVVLVMLVGVGIAVVLHDGTGWPVLLVPAVFAVLLLSLTAFHVRVDRTGLSVRSALGLPAWSIRPEQIASAGVVEVAPLSEFGGWGVRIGRDRRTGVITRAGEALQVRRRSGRALVVTVDDADTAAGLLSTLGERAAGRG